jgi:signal transduction histidine kinase/DNA-binding response OmpR family regulator/HPt (histidine-containing phosphotransfer) domain-containing protein
MPESSRLLIPLRWITIAAIGAIVIVLALDLAGLHGPWRVIALASAAVALACYLVMLRTVRKQIERVSTSAHQAIRAASEAGSHHDAEFDALRSELDEHRRLQAALTAAKQVAEQATLAKGEFLATMSHEVRTPLNGIIPMLDLLQSTKLSLDQREMLNTALQSARQLLRIVDDILDYSKLEANALQLENVGLNLRELLDSVIRLLERQAQAKGLRLSLHIDQEVRTAFRGDPLRLRQILSNLISNALKFTERGSITVNVGRLSETRTHHLLRFEVRDTGVGISPEAASKLFSAFSQADASTTRMYGGTGLGLAICKRIVDLMGGRIGVESELGRGSDFWFEIPMLKTMGEIEGPRIGLLGARALVLTSDSGLQQRLATSLSQSGVKPQFVGTTQEALNLLRNYASTPTRGFDVLVIDLASIKHTVVALHRNLASMDGVERLRIMFLEGGDQVPDEVRALPNAIVVPRTLAENDLRPKLGELLAGEAISTSGRDSRAAVSLAPAQERLDAQARAAAEEVSSAFVPIKGRLLLVEDNPVNLLVAQRLISLAGMLCDTAENGEQALEKLARGHYDIVLMDCQMPVMDGYTATRQWRGHEADNDLQPLPIIAMTANAMAGDRQKCLDAGMDDYLSKPVTREHLESTLRRWLDTPRTRRTAVVQPSAPPTTDMVIDAAEMPELTAPAEAFQSSPIFGMPSGAPAAATKPAAVPSANISPASTQPNGPALDSEIIEDLWSAMGEQFKELVDVFLEDAPGHLTKLEAAAVVGDIAGMAGPAHALKSSSANLGAMQVSAAAKHIEHGARDRTLSNAVDAVSVLSREFQRAEAELRVLLH